MRPYNDKIYLFQEGRRAATRRANVDNDKEYKELLPGQNVLYQQHVGSEWQPATVLAASEEPCSYIRRTSQDMTVRRNRRFIRDPPLGLDMDAGASLEDDRIRSDARKCARLVEQYQDLRFTKPHSSIHDQPATAQTRATHSDNQPTIIQRKSPQPPRRST